MTLKTEKLNHYYSLLMWIVLAGFMLFLFAEPIRDGDVLWHIKYGEYFVQNKTMLVDHSLFSWTPALKYVPYCTWAADIVLYLLFQAGGWPLLYVFKYLCLFSPVVLAGLFTKRAGFAAHGFTFSILILLQLAVGDAAFIKPEIFSLVFFSLVAVLYFNLKIDRLNEKKSLCFLFFPLIFIFWANMHGVFFIGLALLAAIITGELINYLINSKSKFPKRTIFILMISGVLSLASTLLTPYGTDLMRHLLNLSYEGVATIVVNNTFSYQSMIKNIWISTVEYKMEFWGVMCVSFVILFFVNAIKNHDLDFGILLPTIFLALINLKYLRASFYWPPFWAMSIFYLSGKERVDLISGVKNAKPMIKAGCIVLLAGISIFFPLRSIYDHIYRPPRFHYIGYGINYRLPVQESAFLKENNIGTKFFNSYNAGSYLIFDLFPDRKVFIDNRNFPYRDYMYEKYIAFRDGQISLEEMESEFGFDTAVVTNHELVSNYFLASKNWRPVFYGIGGVVLVNNNVKFTNDIKKLDRHRFDGLKNLVQAATVVRTAQNLNDLDTADYVLDIMKNKLSRQGLYDYLYPYCILSQKGLRAFREGDYDSAFEYLWNVGFNDSNVRINGIFKALINMKINTYVKAGKYQDALRLIGRLLNYYRNDEDVLYNAGVIAYLASKQAEKEGMNFKLPSWREAFNRLLIIKPDHPKAHIAKKLLMNEINDEKLSLINENLLKMP